MLRALGGLAVCVSEERGFGYECLRGRLEAGRGAAMQLCCQADGPRRAFPRQAHSTLGVDAGVQRGERLGQRLREDLAGLARDDLRAGHIHTRRRERLAPAAADDLQHCLIVRVVSRSETHDRLAAGVGG